MRIRSLVIVMHGIVLIGSNVHYAGSRWSVDTTRDTIDVLLEDMS